MKQFLVKLDIPATITKTLTVEAEDAQQAAERAMAFLSAEEYVFNSEEESTWTDEDFEKRKVTEVKELDDNGRVKN